MLRNSVEILRDDALGIGGILRDPVNILGRGAYRFDRIIITDLPVNTFFG